MKYLLIVFLFLVGCAAEVDDKGFTDEITVRGFNTRVAAVTFVKDKITLLCLQNDYEGVERFFTLSSFESSKHTYGASGIGKCKK